MVTREVPIPQVEEDGMLVQIMVWYLRWRYS